jgi:hypothetical protein
MNHKNKYAAALHCTNNRHSLLARTSPISLSRHVKQNGTLSDFDKKSNLYKTRPIDTRQLARLESGCACSLKFKCATLCTETQAENPRAVMQCIRSSCQRVLGSQDRISDWHVTGNYARARPGYCAIMIGQAGRPIPPARPPGDTGAGPLRPRLPRQLGVLD